jgi:hypothetical protein
MDNTNAFAGVGVAAMAWPLRGTGFAPTSAHPAAAHAAVVAAAATPPRKRRTATAIVASVDRGSR